MSSDVDAFESWAGVVRERLAVGDHASVRKLLVDAPPPRSDAERAWAEQVRRATSSDPGAAVILGACVVLFVGVAWYFGRS